MNYRRDKFYLRRSCPARCDLKYCIFVLSCRYRTRLNSFCFQIAMPTAMLRLSPRSKLNAKIASPKVAKTPDNSLIATQKSYDTVRGASRTLTCIKSISPVFCIRKYLEDARLTPRTNPCLSRTLAPNKQFVNDDAQ